MNLKSTLYLMLFLFVNIVTAQDSLNVTSVGRIYDFWESARDVVIQDQTAYVATGMSGIQIVDISDTQNPVKLGEIPGFYALLLDVEGDQLFSAGHIPTEFDTVQHWEPAIKIYDVSNPAEAFQTGLFTSDSWDAIVHIACHDGYLYVQSYSHVSIYDISDPNELEELSQINVSFMSDEFLFKDNFVFLICSTISPFINSVTVYDIANPAEPQLVQADEYNEIVEFEIEDDLMCLYDGDQILLYDLSDPDNPELRSEYEFEGDHHISDIRIYQTSILFNDNRKISLLDFSNPDQPAYYENIAETGAEISDIVLEDATMAISTYRGQIFCCSLENIPEHLHSSVFPPSGHVVSLMKRDNQIFTALQDFGMSVINVERPDSPEEISAFPDFGITSFDLEDNIIVGGSEKGLGVIRIEDNESLVNLAYIDSVSTHGVDISGNQALVIDGSDLCLWDITEPENPECQGVIDLDVIDGVDEILRRGDNLIVLSNSWEENYLEAGSFYIMDISDIDRPQTISQLNLDYELLTPVAYQDLIYLVYWDEVDFWYAHETGIAVIDIQDPANPRIVNQFPVDRYCDGLKIYENFLFLNMGGGIRVYDISDPDQMSLVGYFETPGNIEDFVIDDVHAYVADYTSLGIYNWSAARGIDEESSSVPPAGFELLSAFPNPFNSFTTITYTQPIQSTVTLQVFTTRGQLVEVLTNEVMAAGKHSVVWDGNGLSAGVYLVRMTDGGGIVMDSQKMVIVK